MRRVVGMATGLFWVSATLTAILVLLSWVAPGLREKGYFLDMGGVAVGLVMITAAFLFWRERRADRQELRAARQESRDITFEQDREWSSKTWLYAIAFILSFAVSWYLLPHLLFS